MTTTARTGPQPDDIEWPPTQDELPCDDGEPFEEKMKRLTNLLRAQIAEASKIDKTIADNLRELGYE